MTPRVHLFAVDHHIALRETVARSRYLEIIWLFLNDILEWFIRNDQTSTSILTSVKHKLYQEWVKQIQIA